MRRVRLSIAQLLMAVGFCGVAFAALRSGSAWWASGLFTLAVVTLLFGLLEVVYGRGPRRAFWVGFSIVGWGWLLLGIVPEARSQLATAMLFGKLHERIGGNDAVSSGVITFGGGSWIADYRGGPSGFWDAATGRPVFFADPHERLQRIGHTLLTLLLALAGGLAARLRAAGRDSDRAERTGPVA